MALNFVSLWPKYFHCTRFEVDFESRKLFLAVRTSFTIFQFMNSFKMLLEQLTRVTFMFPNAELTRVSTQGQINFLFMANVVFKCYHFSKQFLSNISKIKYLAFFITFCFVVSLAKMVTLTTNIVDKKSAQYWKYIWV